MVSEFGSRAEYMHSYRRERPKIRGKLRSRQVAILQAVARHEDPCLTMPDSWSVMVILQAFIYAGFVIFNSNDQYELTDNGKTALGKAVSHE